jgi:CheY-like chemotaxis protein
MANLHWLLEQLAGRPEARELRDVVDETLGGCERVRVIVRNMKSFTRSDEEQRTAIDVRKALESSISISLNHIRHKAELVREFESVPDVEANAARLGQVFVNLLVNAAQAIPEGAVERNRIRVRTRLVASGRVAIEIQDTGKGIAPEAMAHLFEPFFTTKDVGEGTGLGLWVCRDIVSSLGGEIEVESEPGKGTTFRVLLPTAAGVPEKAAPAPAALASRTARVLVVDDDPLVGSSLRRTLQPEHEVIVLTRAVEAKERIERGERFDVIFCDVMMPEMSGEQLFRAVSGSNPAVAEKFLFLTGGAFTPEANAFVAEVKSRCLEKPFEPARIRALVAERAPAAIPKPRAEIRIAAAAP